MRVILAVSPNLLHKNRLNSNELYQIFSGNNLWQAGDEDFILRESGSSFEYLNGIDHAAPTLGTLYVGFLGLAGRFKFRYLHYGRSNRFLRN